MNQPIIQSLDSNLIYEQESYSSKYIIYLTVA